MELTIDEQNGLSVDKKLVRQHFVCPTSHDVLQNIAAIELFKKLVTQQRMCYNERAFGATKSIYLRL